MIIRLQALMCVIAHTSWTLHWQTNCRFPEDALVMIFTRMVIFIMITGYTACVFDLCRGLLACQRRVLIEVSSGMHTVCSGPVTGNLYNYATWWMSNILLHSKTDLWYLSLYQWKTAGIEGENSGKISSSPSTDIAHANDVNGPSSSFLMVDECHGAGY